ncbi:MAG TPA: glycosyltransferase [Polyangia bacterium]
MTDHQLTINRESEIEVRIDLHVHSRFSDRPYSWFLRSAKSAECYTTPAQVYATAKARGMNLVTLCDHDTIDGAVELRTMADDTFISEEISARFPEDGCIVHTIALDISETQHREIQSLRKNVYELVSYLHHQGVEFFLCHPLSQVNRRLHKEHLQRCLLMFRNLELRNGTRDAAHERALRRILGGLTPAVLDRYAELHPRTPYVNREARYGLVGGSDDHAGLSIARAFTTFEGARSGAGVTAALRARRTVPSGQHGTTAVLQHNVYGVIGGYLQHHHGDDEHEREHEQKPAAAPTTETPAPAAGLAATLAHYGELVLRAQAEQGGVDFAALPARGHTDAMQGQLSQLVETVLVRSSRQALSEMTDELLAARLVEFADKLPAVIKAITVALPAILGARWQGHDIQSARRYSAELGFAERSRSSPRVAVLTDTIDDINGVGIGLRRLHAAARAVGHDLRLISFGDGDHVTTDAEGIIRVPAILRHRLPEYPEMEFAVPHLPSLISCLLEQQVDLVQCSTPGPVGLMGLLAARVVGLPVVGQYHTDLPEYATRLTGDPIVGAMLGRLVGWFYGAVDKAFAPSQAVARRLHELGVPAAQVARLPRGIDLDLFTPARRDAHAFADIDGGAGARSSSRAGRPLTVLYVGRLSREKGLDALLDGFAQAARSQPAARLLLVGEGPAAAALAEQAAQNGLAEKVHFVGFRRGEALATLMASSDLFVSTSETETFGNTVVEAQASGLPVIVAGRGAAHENVVDGVTGLVVDGRRPEEIGAAIDRLLTDAPTRVRMGRAAAAFAQKYDMKSAAEGTFQAYRRVLAERAPAAAPAPRERASAMAPANDIARASAGPGFSVCVDIGTGAGAGAGEEGRLA